MASYQKDELKNPAFVAYVRIAERSSNHTDGFGARGGG